MLNLVFGVAQNPRAIPPVTNLRRELRASRQLKIWALPPLGMFLAASLNSLQKTYLIMTMTMVHHSLYS